MEKHSGQHMSLSLQKPSDMLKKLEWEVRAIEEFWDKDFESPGYATINAAITAWQLGDWVFHTLKDSDRLDAASEYFRSDIRSKKDLQDKMRECEELVACQQIALACKHYYIDGKPYRPGFSIEEYFDVFERDEPTSSGNNLRIHRSLNVTFPMTVIDGRPTIREYSVRLVMRDALAWWSTSLNALGLS